VSLGNVLFWDAVNRYAQACGGDTSGNTASLERCDAVVAVEREVEALLKIHASLAPAPSPALAAAPVSEEEGSEGRAAALEEAARHYDAVEGCDPIRPRHVAAFLRGLARRAAPPPSTGDEARGLVHLLGPDGATRCGLRDDNALTAGVRKNATCEECLSPSPRAQTDEGRRCAIVTEPILGCPKCHRTWEVCEGVADRLATATAALRREERDA
jgi:hypothetical protein